MIGGDAAKNGPLSARSPVHLVDKIKAPLLVAYGGRDRVVPFWEHARVLKHEIEKSDRNVDWVFFEQEGHGFRKPDNLLEFYRRMKQFLAQHLAPLPVAGPLI